MSKVIALCGRICVGKTTYARKLREQNNGVILSVDEITLALFGQDAGENHDTYVERAEAYLFEKSLELIRAGVDVILDWGFWMKEERDQARAFYAAKGVAFEIHCLSISGEQWRARREKRNAEILAGRVNAYYVDDGLAAKCDGFFQPPTEDENVKWIET